MNVEDQQKELDRLNQKIIKLDYIIKKIRFRRIQNYLMRKKLLPLMNLRDECFRNLRDATRAKYPERMIGFGYK